MWEEMSYNKYSFKCNFIRLQCECEYCEEYDLDIIINDILTDIEIIENN